MRCIAAQYAICICSVASVCYAIHIPLASDSGRVGYSSGVAEVDQQHSGEHRAGCVASTYKTTARLHNSTYSTLEAIDGQLDHVHCVRDWHVDPSVDSGTVHWAKSL